MTLVLILKRLLFPLLCESRTGIIFNSMEEPQLNIVVNRLKMTNTVPHKNFISSISGGIKKRKGVDFHSV